MGGKSGKERREDEERKRLEGRAMKNGAERRGPQNKSYMVWGKKMLETKGKRKAR